jgi:hypothetical protein
VPSLVTPSSASTITQSIVALVPAGSTTTLSSSLNPSQTGNRVTYVATVSPPPDGGSVTFLDGTSAISGCASVAVGAGGEAVCTTSYTVGGAHSIGASYSGDPDLGPSSAAPITEIVNRAVYWLPAPPSATPPLSAVGPPPACAGLSGNGAFLCVAYEELLGRTPDAAGLSLFLGLLSTGASRTLVASDLLNSTEYHTDLANDMYEQILSRPADPGGLATFVQLLSSGASEDQVIADMVGSPEFFSDSGGSNGSFVDHVYQALLGHAPDAAGLEFFVEQLNAGLSPTAVATEVVGSVEYQRDAVTFDYRYLLDRDPDPGAFSTQLGILDSGGGLEAVVANIVGSPEFFADAAG